MDVVEAIITLCKCGEYRGLSLASGQEDISRVLGSPQEVSSRKSSQVMSYMWGEVLIENHSLRQMTFDSLTDEQKERLSLYVKENRTRQIERIEGFCRYYRMEDVHSGVESVIYATRDSDDSIPQTFAVLFPHREMESLTLSLSREVMEELRHISSAKRISIQEICTNIIEEHIKNYKE